MRNIFWVVQIKNKHTHTYTVLTTFEMVTYTLTFTFMDNFGAMQTKIKNAKLPLFSSLSKVLKIYFQITSGATAISYLVESWASKYSVHILCTVANTTQLFYFKQRKTEF